MLSRIPWKKSTIALASEHQTKDTAIGKTNGRIRSENEKQKIDNIVMPIHIPFETVGKKLRTQLKQRNN